MIDVAIVGAGPYGLSAAAYFRQRGIAFRIFGPPMDSWLAHMPKGMLLKSEGFASDLFDPEKKFALKAFCAERGIAYSHDASVPVRLDTFTSYGLAFKDRMVPNLENKLVESVDRAADGFVLRLDDGETLEARRVVLAVGITHFAYIPPNLAQLPPELLSHSSDHCDLERFRGRRVIVVGGGSSAMDMAALLHAAGAAVQMVSRRKQLKFPPKPDGKPRSLWQQFRHPASTLGNGLRRRFLADWPLAFRYLPQRLRLYTVRRSLGPSGGWFSKDMVIGRVPLLLGCVTERVESRDGVVQLHLRQADGTAHTVAGEHVIAATGYRVAIARLKFLSEQIRSGIQSVDDTPILSSHFESSIPGLYFAGVAAANCFGPVMRFACGAGFTAQRLTKGVMKSLSRERIAVPQVLRSDQAGI